MIPVCERGVVENDQRGSMRILCHGYPLRPLSLPPPEKRARIPRQGRAGSVDECFSERATGPDRRHADRRVDASPTNGHTQQCLYLQCLYLNHRIALDSTSRVGGKHGTMEAYAKRVRHRLRDCSMRVLPNTTMRMAHHQSSGPPSLRRVSLRRHRRHDFSANRCGIAYAPTRYCSRLTPDRKAC